MPSAPIMNIYLVEDEADVAEGLDWLFRSRGLKLEHFGSVESFLATMATRPTWWHEPACLLLDIRMRHRSGLELFDHLRQFWRKEQGLKLDPVPVIFLSGHADISIAVEALKNGAFDFFEKPAKGNDLVNRALEAIEESKRRQSQGQTAMDAQSRLALLSKREQDVARLVLIGRLNKQIADDLSISMRTVEVHRANIFSKMGVRSAVELARLLETAGMTL
jgi:two-component system, LuxR family, response regulator DctR